MLYEGAVKFMDRALSGFDKEDPAEANETINNNILRAQQILTELNASLDLDQGGDIALHLRRIYLHVDWRLTQSNIAKEAAGIHESIARLTVLRDAWAGMLQGQNPSGAARLPSLALA